jgi:hypothetical protein
MRRTSWAPEPDENGQALGMGTIPAALGKPANQQDGGGREAGGKREVRQPLQGFCFYRAPSPKDD